MGKNVQSFKVATTLTANRIVYVSAADTVAYTTAITDMPVGVTLDTVLDTNQAIPVAMVGERAKVYFNDTVSAAGLIGFNSAGQAIPFVAATGTSYFAGVLLGDAVAATGTIA